MKLQDQVIQFLDLYRPKVWYVKVMQGNRNGTPDIQGSFYGRHFGIEVKDGKDTLKDLQYEELCRIIEANGFGLVVVLGYHRVLMNNQIRKMEQEDRREHSGIIVVTLDELDSIITTHLAKTRLRNK